MWSRRLGLLRNLLKLQYEGRSTVRGRFAVGGGGAYAGTLRRTILAYKRGRRDVGEALAAWLAERCGPFDPSAVPVSVPTTGPRRAERGFDQSVRLARRLAALRERPVLLALWHRAGDSQRGRTRTARLAARNRFACAGDHVFRGVRIVLVDDVVTTGATLADSAQTLRARGAVVEDAVVLASAGHTVPRRETARR